MQYWNNKFQEAVKGHDCPRPEDTWHRKMRKNDKERVT